ncbi:MAG: recombinase, partial [Candidatus Thiodiazotropha sp. (ex Lucinoma kastoroae)]|nr:recombinase [Candidatus Thiodiazotropha sp. (ex Lucinoma kastoroae)]
MALEAELKQIDRKIDNLLDRVVEADSQSLVVRYENRIKELEDSRIVMEEKAAQCGRTLADFEKGFRITFEFLG